MAVAYKTGAGFADGTSVTSVTQNTITPAVGDLIVMFIVSRITSGTPAAPTVTNTGWGGSWTKVADFPYQTSTANDTRLTIWNCLVTSSAAGAPTADFAGVTQTVVHTRAEIYSGHSQAGTNASDAFPQAAQTGTGTGTSASVTLGALRNANSRAVGFIAHNAVEGTTGGSGYTVEYGSSWGATTAPIFADEDKGNTTTVDASWTTSSAFGIIGIEIAEAQIVPAVNVVDFAVARAANY